MKDKDKINLLIEETYKVAEKFHVLVICYQKLPLWFQWQKDYIEGTYDKPPVSVVLSIVAALIYLVSIVDLIPDTMPGVVYIDDVAVISTCWKLIDKEINEYMIWKNIEL